MKQYTVTLKETVYYTVTVEAPDADQAGENAAIDWADSATPTEDFSGEGHGVEVVGVA